MSKRHRGSRPTPRHNPGHRDVRLAIATPAYGQMVTQAFAISLQQTTAMFERAGRPLVWLTNALANVRHGRNELVAACLALPEMTHLLWIDADISYDPADVLKLLAYERDIVAGAYRKKQGTIEFAMRLVVDDDGMTRQLANGLLEADYAGLGFMLIRREVFLRLIEAYPERAMPQAAHPSFPALKPWTFDLHPDGIEVHGIHGEDVGFCRLWRSIGGAIWIDPAIKLTHHGMYGFAGDMATLVAAAPQVAEAA